MSNDTSTGGSERLERLADEIENKAIGYANAEIDEDYEGAVMVGVQTMLEWRDELRSLHTGNDRTEEGDR